MIMTPGSGGASNYTSYIKNCTAGQHPYKIPVNNLQDVQLYINIGATAPTTAEYQIIATCGPDGGDINSIVPDSYVIGQDTNENWYGVFKDFQGTAPSCFVIAITLDGQIYFSEEYCIEPPCNELTLLKGCYGNLDNKLSYDCEGVYFGTPEVAAMGDSSVKYEHKLLLRNVEVSLAQIKNTFKQGRTRSFRTEKEKIYQFTGDFVPEWYMGEIDAVFYRGEVYVGAVKYLLNETSFEKIEECKRIWKPDASFKESCYQSFSCEADPCATDGGESGGGGESGESGGGGNPCCDPTIISATANQIEGFVFLTIEFNECTPTPANGYNIQWRLVDSVDPFTDAGNFASSPAVFSIGPGELQAYEGIIRSDVSEGSGSEYCNDVNWTTSGQSEDYLDKNNYSIAEGPITGTCEGNAAPISLSDAALAKMLSDGVTVDITITIVTDNGTLTDVIYNYTGSPQNQTFNWNNSAGGLCSAASVLISMVSVH